MITFLLDCTIKVSIIITAALIGLRMLRSYSAAVRHWVLSSALLCAALVPAFSLVLPPLNVEVSEAVPAGMVYSGRDSAEPLGYVELEPVAGSAVPPPEAAVGEDAPSAATVPSAPFSLVQGALLIWFGGVLSGFALLIAGVTRLAWIGRRSDSLLDAAWIRLARKISGEYGLRRSPRLLRSTGRCILATWGFLRPDVLLPGDSDQWSEDRIEVVLSHELAHVRRGDWLIQVLAAMVRAFYWFNPLAWILCRRLDEECERACDDAVLDSGISATRYAGHLLELARALHRDDRAWVPALPMARRSNLAGRFQSMLTPGVNRNGSSYSSAAVTLAAFVLISLPVAALRASTATPEPRPVIEGEPTEIAAPAWYTFTGAPEVRPAATGSQNPQRVPSSGPASISGSVVRKGSNTPLAKASVELRLVEWTTMGPAQYSTTTRADGSFALENVAPGEYRMLAATYLEGYVTTEYGQASPRLRGSVISISPGQRLRNLQIAMTPTGSITGRVIDKDGDPVGRAQVQALRTEYRGGRKVLGIVQSVLSNDLGEYRLFWLPPDGYYITAKPENPDRPSAPLYVVLPGLVGTFTQTSDPTVVRSPLDNGGIAEDAYVPVYYPGVLDARGAKFVEVRPDQNVTGTDINVSIGRLRGRHIRGTVIDAGTGQPAPNTRINVISRALSDNATVPNGMTDASGRFDISGVVQGQYFLSVALHTPNVNGGFNIDTTAFPAFVPIEVGGSDLEGLRIVARPGITLTGRITIDGRPPLANDLDTPPLEIAYSYDPDGRGVMKAERGLLMGPRRSTPVNGAISMTIAPGQYQFDVGGLAPNMYVKSMRLGSTDLLAGPTLLSSQPQGQMDVVIGTDAGSLVGRVMNAKRDPVAGATIVMVPDVPRRSRLDLYQVVKSDASGRFQFPGLEPGGYKIFAWEDVEEGFWHDPDFIQQQEGRGRAIRVNPNGRETVEITSIP